ncbi:MAG: DNA recombination protein RmuC [Chitinophagaceae bacterium]
MTNEYFITLIASIAGAIFVTLIIAIVITRLVMLRKYEPKASFVALQDEFNKLQVEHASLNSRAEMLLQQDAAAHALAKERLDESQLLSTNLATASQRVQNLDQHASDLAEQLKDYRAKWEISAKESIEKGNNLHRLKAEQEAQAERFLLQEATLQNMEAKMAKTFELLAGQTLDSKTNSFKETQAAEFTHLLAPLKQELTDLKLKLNETHTNASAERNTLFGQVKEMIGQTKQLSEQADNLTKALKGQAKQQGDWGEWILESILEYSGLSKDREYFLQHNEKNEGGSNIRPDVLVKYPDNRYMVIDSKVTLVGYERLVASTEKDEQQMLLAALVRHLKAHIDGLSSKQYQQKKDALDFVVMFVPLEGAYIAAMQFEPDLWKYAYDKRIFLLSPTNLVAALKLVHNMWQKDAINKNAEDIAARAALMYDKLVGFLEVFEKVGKNIEQAGAAFTDARKKLTAGKGNLIIQAEQMNQLQKRQASDKQLPEKLVDDAIFENGGSIKQLQ